MSAYFDLPLVMALAAVAIAAAAMIVLLVLHWAERGRRNQMVDGMVPSGAGRLRAGRDRPQR